jgi:hypothetical protein
MEKTTAIKKSPKKMKYHSVGKTPKSNIKIIERGKLIPLTHKYTTAQFYAPKLQ